MIDQSLRHERAFSPRPVLRERVGRGFCAYSRERRTNASKLAATRAFTIVEFMVLILILTILLSIFIPYLMKLREMDRRTRCADNLKQIYTALRNYAASNNSAYPRVVYDEVNNPTGYTAFTGANDPNPFAPNSTVRENDVTASLWLLVRGKLIEPKVFICPSTDDEPSPKTSGNFAAPTHLSYSYSSPFSNAPNYRMDDLRRGDFALMADKSPGTIDVPFGAPILELSPANSANHGQAGQNVLYTGYVRFEKTPYCGVQGDNIYTALSPTPLIDKQLPPKGSGYLGHDIGPAWEGDSYLVPTATDVASPARTAPSTQPATVPTSAPTEPSRPPATTTSS